MVENMDIVSSRFPYLRITLMVLSRTLKIEALIDTGFDGDVVVPPKMIMNGRPPSGHTRWTLADGSISFAPYFLGSIKIGKFKPIGVSISALGDEPLIGRGVTDKFKVIFDHGKKVIVEQ